MSEDIQALIFALATGVSNAQLYSFGRESADTAARRLLTLLAEFPENRARIMVVERELVVNDRLFRNPGLHGEKLVRQLSAKGLSSIEILEDADVEELARFITDLARPEEPVGSYSHIRAGRVRVRLVQPGALTAAEGAAFTGEQIERLQAAYATVSPFQELEVTGLEEIVANFLVIFRRGANLLRLISPVRSHSAFTYTHAMNVAVLSMALAEHLGFEDAVVRELGIAALMHDVGKLFISKELLHKPGALSGVEFAEITRHPLLGAAYLAKREGVGPLVPVVALEHHRRFDGSGYPAPQREMRRQHVASQIVALADFYDALRSHRPYRRSVPVEEILALIRKGAGKDFNPELAERFALLIARSVAAL